MTDERVWLRPPHGQGEPKQVEAKPELLIPLMLAGWRSAIRPNRR